MADYSSSKQYQDALQQLVQQGIQQSWGTGHPDLIASQTTKLQTELNQLGDQFSSQFNNLVGRDPTQDEINQFFSQSAAPTLGGVGLNPVGNQAAITNDIQSFVGGNFRKTAQDYATQQLQQQNAQAGNLADLFQQQGQTAINNTQQSLLDYQNKLFERLRPNLITSLQSQGLLNTGGFNEAVAGVQGDLANNASNYIAQLQLNNQQAANQIRFGGAAAPYYYQQGNITQNPQYLQQVGQGAQGFNNNTFMSNLDYQHQLGLINAQSQTQPSFLRQFATNLAGSAGQGLGQAAGAAMFA